MKIRALWDIAPCSLGVECCFRDAYCLHHQGDNPHYGGSRHLWNVGLLRDYTALYPRMLSSSYSLPWEPQILHTNTEIPKKEIISVASNVNDIVVGCETKWYCKWLLHPVDGDNRLHSSEVLVTTYQSTRRHTTKHGHQQHRWSQNFIYQNIN
jgi:hypothetical protein